MSRSARSRRFVRIVGLWITVWALSSVAATAARRGAAFPWAVGYGAESQGGRGGRALMVTRLDDKVARPVKGMLRWALEQSGRRIVIFRVAGTIELAGKLHVENPYLTIAGQTAPGGGITLKNYPMYVHTHNVIVSGLRFRPGAKLPNSDAFNIIGPSARDIVVDHCSFSWANDEVLATSGGAYNVSIQNSIVSEGLDCSIHPEGCHSRGLLVRDGSRNISIHHSFFSHNDFRNPKMLGERLGGRRAAFEFFNNVVYDWGSWAVAGAGVAQLNVEANYFRLGPSTYRYPEIKEIRSLEESGSYRLWVDGNVGPTCPRGCADDWQMVGGTQTEFKARRRHRTVSGRPKQSAVAARNQVMSTAGASYRLDELGRRVYRRDAVDRRLVRQFWRRTGGIIDDPAEVGGWPLLSRGLPVVDSDSDGMPDAWENAHDLDPYDAADGRLDLDGDLSPNLDEYLFETDPTVPDLTFASR